MLIPNNPYKLEIDAIIRKLKEVYERAPDEFVEKHWYLFAYAFRKDKDKIIHAEFSYFPETYNIVTDGKVIHVERLAGNLFYVLASKPGRMMDRRFLSAYLWNEEESGSSLKVLVHKLKKRLDGTRLQIKNVYGEGYFLEISPK